MITRRHMLAGAATLTTFAFMGPGLAQEKANDRLKVLATFSILGDFVKNVGGNRVEVTTLVGPDSDAHVYAPAPADPRKVAEAKLVIVNGLGFEGWMSRLVTASGSKAPVAVASEGITARKAEVAKGRGRNDPHAWQSVTNAKVYVSNIYNAMVSADPAGRITYEANTAAYLAKLDSLDREVKAAIYAIPPERRRIITTHDAFGYFEQDYYVDFIAPEGVSTQAEPSARDIARIITQIKRLKIPAVFLENIADPRLMQQIAKESGARVGGKLYSDALTDEKGEAPNYIALMRHNIKELTAALAG
jgi:zinc/manganese transport system substrate-binding protein